VSVIKDQRERINPKSSGVEPFEGTFILIGKGSGACEDRGEVGELGKVREVNPEEGAPAILPIEDLDPSLISLNDRLNDGKTETHPSFPLGGKERLEDPGAYLGGDSDPPIRNLDDRLLPAPCFLPVDPKDDRLYNTRRLGSIEGIQEKVDQDLLEIAPVAEKGRKIGGKVKEEGNTCLLKGIVYKELNLPDETGELLRLGSSTVRSGVLKEVLYEFIDPGNLPFHLLKLLLHRLRGEFVLLLQVAQKLNDPGESRKRVVKLVGNPSSKLSQGCKFFYFHDPLLDRPLLLALLYVGGNIEDEKNDLRMIRCGRNPDNPQPDLPLSGMGDRKVPEIKRVPLEQIFEVGGKTRRLHSAKPEDILEEIRTDLKQLHRKAIRPEDLATRCGYDDAERENMEEVVQERFHPLNSHPSGFDL
jgi:hypothetical protein